MNSATRIEYGDWQTPLDLANSALARVVDGLESPARTVLEPTCGKGTFLVAAARHLPHAKLYGYEINREYVEVATSTVGGPGLVIQTADFFTVDWEREIAKMAAPILVVGNPPWVTSADIGALGAGNLPSKRNFKKLCGLDALTGKSNFDVSEWMILRLLQALSGKEATVAMLCKSAVARRVVEFSARQSWAVRPGGVWRIDAGRHFDAAVDAVLFVCRVSRDAGAGAAAWPVYASLESTAPETTFGVADGGLVADPAAYSRTRALVGQSDPEWRSGLKHDCARVMELERRGEQWVNGAGEVVDIEPAYCYPLLKSSDLANGRLVPARSVVVPQRVLGEDTTVLRDRAPRLWAYLKRHREALDGRKSSIYRGQPPFAIFGVGDYSFAPWKVAISGLYKRIRFNVVGPHERQAVMVDDTCYFLPFASEPAARQALSALESDLATDFFRGRIFWDAKRPINKSVLQSLDLGRLMQALGWAIGPLPGRAVQQTLGF
ncbi:MAG: SAM-dependent methyltransferase [Polyangiaceae bacterium]|nr:SAM-dependent methyltransferase [Polyangiaceae bacterium]